MSKSPYMTAPAFLLKVDDRAEVDVRVSFEDGQPLSVSFLDSERNGLVSIPFDLWGRVTQAVDKTVDMNRAEG